MLISISFDLKQNFVLMLHYTVIHMIDITLTFVKETISKISLEITLFHESLIQQPPRSDNHIKMNTP